MLFIYLFYFLVYFSLTAFAKLNVVKYEMGKTLCQDNTSIWIRNLYCKITKDLETGSSYYVLLCFN